MKKRRTVAGCIRAEKFSDLFHHEFTHFAAACKWADRIDRRVLTGVIGKAGRLTLALDDPPKAAWATTVPTVRAESPGVRPPPWHAGPTQAGIDRALNPQEDPAAVEEP